MFRAVSNPLEKGNLFFNLDNIPENLFSSLETLAEYLKSLSETSIEVSQLGFYGREVRHLFKNGYKFDAATKTFIK